MEENLVQESIECAVLPQYLPNEDVIERIVDRIWREFVIHDTEGILRQSDLQISEVEIDYWSFIFQVNWQTGNGQRGVFVKIPRNPLQKPVISQALADPLSLQMGQAEFLSLSRLYEFWTQHPSKRFGAIKPLIYWPEWNTIVTERVNARDLYVVLRTAACMPRISGRLQQKELFLMLGSLGEWLADFQLDFDSTESRILDSRDYAADIEGCWQTIGSYSRHQRKIRSIAERVNQIKIQSPQTFCPHLEGFEIRNVVVERSSNRLFVLDPGQINFECYLENIAGFLISLDILYWGTSWFLLRWSFFQTMHSAFLEGFTRRIQITPHWLLFFKIKELIHSWGAACLVLDRKKLPAALKVLLQSVYVDRFYIEELARCLSQLDRFERGLK
jgi:hypothetical protein